MSHESDSQRSSEPEVASRQRPREARIDELIDRLLMVVVDLGWTPPGWQADGGDSDDGAARPHHAWLLERLGDLAYVLAQHAAERDPRALAQGEPPSRSDSPLPH